MTDVEIEMNLAFERGRASRDAEIESLRQQLADMQGREIVEYVRHDPSVISLELMVSELKQQLAEVKIVSDHNLKVYQDAAENLRQQLASSNGHNIMLRNAIKPFAEGCWSRDLQTQAREALAATEPK